MGKIVRGGADGMIETGSGILTSRPRLTEANLSDPRFAEGIAQLKNAVNARSLTKGEAGLHVIGSMVLQSFKNGRKNFVHELATVLNEAVCDSPKARFRATVSLGPSAHEVLNAFANEKGVELLSAGWLELVDSENRETDKRLLGVFVLPNGRKGVGIFQVFE
jgi:hypothetical protein